MPKILIVDDDPAFCSLLSTFLKKNKFQTKEVHSGKECVKAIYEETFDIVLTDFRLPDLDGIELLKNIKKKFFHMPVIIMTSYANIRTAVKAMQQGAFEYVTKPINPDEILISIKNALESEAEPEPNATKEEKPKSTAPSFTFVQGKSLGAVSVQKHIELVAPTNLSVIIQGESGTGKEYVSRLIHEKSLRKNKPFVALDCGALSDELAGSELFGHVKGAFTGAIQDKTGVFESADGGTLFLDEIGNLSYEIQVKLLRAIQESRIRKVGSTQDVQVDVRLIVATNEYLDVATRNGNFREDLYHRLNEFQIRVPALRERKEDIALFAEYFLEQSNKELGKHVSGFAHDVRIRLMEYYWPGNIRELKNVIRRSVLLATSEYITQDTLPAEIITPVTQSIFDDQPKVANPDLKAAQERTERALIEETLKKVRYNKSKAAKMLNIDRKTLYNKLRLYDIDI